MSRKSQGSPGTGKGRREDPTIFVQTDQIMGPGCYSMGAKGFSMRGRLRMYTDKRGVMRKKGG